MNERSRLPNFLIVGAMKCGTSTLHEQLAHQPGIFMTDPKEPNFFSNDECYAAGQGAYEALFANAADAHLRGESSTHYTKLPTYPNTVTRMRALLPDLKLVYMMRHPIKRLVSHYLHELSLRECGGPIDRAVERHPELVDYGCYHMQLAPLFDAYGRDNVLPVFLERMQREPQRELERVCAFLGYEGRPRWVPEVAHQNGSSERMRLGTVGRKLFENPKLIELRRAWVPQRVRDVAKELLRLHERPELAQASLTRLTLRFDYDLAQLGRELGLLHLCCDNFEEVVSARPLGWSDTKAPTKQRAAVTADSSERAEGVPLGLWSLLPQAR
jgi:hypothetical protein